MNNQMEKKIKKRKKRKKEKTTTNLFTKYISIKSPKPMFKRNPKVIPIFFTKDKDIHEISNSMDEQKGDKV